jgi:hypothetical protein
VQSEVAELDPQRVVHEADSAQADNAVRLPMNSEWVQMGVVPAQQRLENDVKLGYGGVASDQKTPPDQWADLAEHNTELIHAAGHDPLLMAGLYPERAPMLSLGLHAPPVFSAFQLREHVGAAAQGAQGGAGRYSAPERRGAARGSGMTDRRIFSK